MERVAPSDDFHCTCGRVLGDPHPSGNWMVYPNPLICSECGKGFLRESHIQRQRRKHPMSKGELQFHDKKCQGRWLGKHHGGSNRKSDAA